MSLPEHISTVENPSFRSSQTTMSDFFPGIVYIYDLGSRNLTYINKKATELTGYALTDLQGWKNMIYKDDQDIFLSNLEKGERLPGLQTHNFTCRYTLKTNHWKFFNNQLSVLDRLADGTPSTLLIIAQDVSIQILAEEELRKSKELMKEVEELLEFGTWTWDFTRDKIYRSPGTYKLFGYDDSILEKVKDYTLDEEARFYIGHIAKEDRSKIWDVIHKSRAEKSDFEVEYRAISITGEERNLIARAKAVRDENGALLKFLGVTGDVTKLTRYRREIESYLAELNRSNKELEEFAFVASHDLQEPLRKIITFSERLQAKFKTSLGSEGSTYLSRMTVATENMRTLIDNLLEFSRITRNKEAFALTDLNDILDEARSELELKIEETGADIQYQTLPNIVCNAPQIKQLFVNLLSNSLKFRDPQTPTRIRITAEPLSFQEKLDENLPMMEDYVKIAFTDNGIGFEKEYADRIFQIFQRLHGKSEYPGSGIGLAICKKIVDRHKGLIRVDSAPLKGSVFSLFLPIHH
jgi:signal transduction histidine kinase